MLGVTLIELMIVIVVLAILASIAVPSYRSYLIRAQRSEGTGALLQIQQAQEKYFIQNSTYGTLAQLNLPNVTANNRYDVDFPVLTATTYTARVVPHAGGGQTDDTKCTQMTITEQGQRDSSPSPIATCWK
ncbi:MAG TPA: type IV pilin protein, partial [Steroidobacteraceae bacterium]